MFSWEAERDDIARRGGVNVTMKAKTGVMQRKPKADGSQKLEDAK